MKKSKAKIFPLPAKIQEETFIVENLELSSNLSPEKMNMTSNTNIDLITEKKKGDINFEFQRLIHPFSQDKGDLPTQKSSEKLSD